MVQSNINCKKITISIITFTLGAAIIIGAGAYKKTLANEAPTFKASFEKDNKIFKEFVYDIKNQGFVKRFVQPGKVSVTTGHGGGIVNKTDRAILLNVKTEGLLGEPEIESTDPAFDKKSKKFTKPLEPGKSLSLGVDLEIPRNLLNQNNVSQGNVIFEDADGTLLAKLPVKIINSGV